MMRHTAMAVVLATLKSTSAFVPFTGTLSSVSRTGLGIAARRNIHRSSTVRMLFWKPPPVSEHTRLAKQPPLDKGKNDEEWEKELKPNAFLGRVVNGQTTKVLRKKATEPARAPDGFDEFFETGTYVCAGCRTPLYESSHKFECGCGWPGFWTNIKDAVFEEGDADGMRSEIMCSSCGGHLGHVFRGENFNNPEPNERHCVNSLSLAFIPEGKKDGPDAIECGFTGRVFGGMP